MNFKWDLTELKEFAERLKSTEQFDSYLKQAAEKLAKVLLEMMKRHTPIGETRKLITGWQDAIIVEKVKNGCKVTLLNDCSYAKAVNDGHISKNQFGGPYEVKNRIKVKQAKQWQLDPSKWYVFGHFFVEEGIVDVQDEVEKIIYPYLEKWWGWCVSGK